MCAMMHTRVKLHGLGLLNVVLMSVLVCHRSGSTKFGNYMLSAVWCFPGGAVAATVDAYKGGHKGHADVSLSPTCHQVLQAAVWLR
jgi:hypothetical protein